MSEEAKEPRREDLGENDLPAKVRALYLRGLSAFELRNWGYAKSLIQGVLKEEPAFLEGRKKLRTAAIKEHEGSKKGMKLGGDGLKMKMAGTVKKDPEAAMLTIEKEVLGADPYSPQGNLLLSEAALAVGLPLTAGFALETLTKGHPDNTKYMHNLGEFYMEQEEFSLAAEVYGEIRKKDPADLVAIKAEKDATARESMVSQKWEGGSFEDLKKSSDESKDLEQASRAAMTPDMLREKVAQLSQEYAADQHNLDLSKRIADCYEQLEDWANAVTFYEWAFSLSGKDPSLERKVAEMKEKKAGEDLKQLEAFVRDNPDHEDVESVKAQIADLRASQSAELIEEARVRVDRNPTDMALRFDYGSRLFDAHKFRDAIPQLQQAKRSPNLRIKAMLMLGKCYEQMNMNDLAAQQFEEAATEIPTMDDTKKDLLYNLGLLYEKMGNKTSYLESLKQIYAADYGYRDVAERVESSYQGGSGGSGDDA